MKKKIIVLIAVIVFILIDVVIYFAIVGSRRNFSRQAAKPVFP